MNSQFRIIKEKIDVAQSLGCIDDNAVLSTHCLYDGGEQVNVYFYPEKNGLFTVSDAGNGARKDRRKEHERNSELRCDGCSVHRQDRHPDAGQGRAYQAPRCSW